MRKDGHLRGLATRAADRLRPPLARLQEWCPLTLRGAGVLASCGFALWLYGFQALDRVWYVAGVGLIGLCAAAVVSVLSATLRMGLWLSREPGRAESERVFAETRQPLQTGFLVPRLRFWPFVEPRVEWLDPAFAEIEEAREGSLLTEQVRLWDHGEIRRVTRRIVLRDVFGLSSVALRKRANVDLAVLPHAGSLRSLPLLRSLAGGDDMPHPLGIAQGDRLELRRYAPGDPARFIHWKVYARTQKLVVRMPERALSRAHRVAAFLLAGEQDAASAAAARVALEEAAFGTDFCFGADGSPEPARSLEPALSSIRRSSGARERSGRDLEAFVANVEKQGPASYVLFVPSVAGEGVEAVRRMVSAQGHPVRIVIGIDGLENLGRAPWWSRLTLRESASSRVQLEALRDSMSAYKRMNCDVVVLDRESGRALGDAHLQHAARHAQGVAA
ncbi:MAG: DUF58 domain-containing protein [Myxococcales bacterium]